MRSAGSWRGDVLQVNYQDLQLFTGDFSEENFICKAQFCKLYRGNIPPGWRGIEGRDVTVKVWVDVAEIRHTYVSKASYSENQENLRDEMTLLKHHNASSCPNLPILMAFCKEDEMKFLGVVYDLKSLDTLRNLVDKDEFTWLDRIKVAVQLASFLEVLHGYEPKYLVRDLSAAHIMLDQDFNPILFNYFMLTGGVIGERESDLSQRRNRFYFGSHGYIDEGYLLTGAWSEKTDVFALGVILCELLFKRKVDYRTNPQTGVCPFLYFEAYLQYPLEGSKFSFKKSKKYSFVDKSFEKQPGFDAQDGPKISKLARLCVDSRYAIRPTVQNVVKRLKELSVVREQRETIGA